jgi:molybdate transport system permease protein
MQSWLPPDDLTAFALTLKLAAVTVAILIVLGSPLAWWLARTRWRGKAFIEAVVALPLVLPPTVLGFYLLVLLGPNGWLGGGLLAAGLPHLAFTFTGLIIGSVLFSLPFAIQPLQDAFTAIGQRPLEVAATLRAGALDRFFSVALPLARRGYLTAVTLAFAHTLGEFGVVLMIGGNIPGETRVVSIAIYDHAQAFDYAAAHRLSALLLGLSFVMLLAVYLFNGRVRAARP